MTPFVGGIILGFIAAAALFGAMMVVLHRPRRQPPLEWTEEFHERPHVTTRLLIRERNLEL